MSKGGSIHFRDQQSLQTFANDEGVKIFAPKWVKSALNKLSPKLQGAQFKLDSKRKHIYAIHKKMTLIDLVAIARNERANTTGIIKYNQYTGFDKKTILALRDLVKHCVIVGKDVATHFGGYPHSSALKALNKEVYICDLPGLQFQQLDNTGRHVLICKDNTVPKGDLDDDIFENTVGEKKPTYLQAEQNHSDRFIKANFKGKEAYFDTKAYQAFVAQDFVLAATALNAQAKLEQNTQLNFKFLKYGAGFFADGLAGDAKDQLSENLTKGVLKGLRQWLALPLAMRSCIKRIELPFFKEQGNQRLNAVLDEIQAICRENNLEFASTNSDALAPTSRRYVTATTNCSDPHAPTGNEMHYGSVDAAIAENLARKGNNFSPICNKKMKYQFMDRDALEQEVPNLNLLANQKPSTLYAFGASALWIGAGFALSLGMNIILAGILIPVVLKICSDVRDHFKKSQYESYAGKNRHDFSALNNTQQVAFDLGIEAAKSYQGLMHGLIAWQAYRSPKAYYAGYEAQQINDEQLIHNVRRARGR